MAIVVGLGIGGAASVVGAAQLRGHLTHMFVVMSFFGVFTALGDAVS